MTRNTLTIAQAQRYRVAAHQEKRRIPDEFVATTGYNRKYASHLLSRWALSTFVQIDAEVVELVASRSKPTPREGHRRYGSAVDEALEKLWNLFDCMCGKRLVVAIAENLEELALRLGIRAEVQMLLLEMSPAGYFQVDTVGHDGGSSYGEFCFTLTAVDVCSGWTELRALLNKAKRWVREGLADIRKRLPFALQGINSDSGGEFINNTIYEFCTPEIEFTRSRPNKKNDNCYVECRNDTAVRQHLGPVARFTGQQARDALAEVYRYLCPLMNHVYPSMKLIEKRREGSKVHRRHDKPKTPYQRLIDDPRLSKEGRQRLRAEHREIDIIELSLGLQRALAEREKEAAHYPQRAAESSIRLVAGS